MNFDVSSFKKNYLSFLIRKTSESYKKLGDDEVVGFIMYLSEKERKKPGILRRKGESIEKRRRLLTKLRRSTARCGGGGSWPI
ncbi:MAG: hypothetical protein QXV31_01580 [Zestosphaera sp.]